MKICVYTIAKNEKHYISRWYDSVKEADYICVLDTGSTDGTYEALKKLPIICDQKIIKPWRFDIARNESLKLIPKDADFCMVIDIDEYLETGWRQTLESCLKSFTEKDKQKHFAISCIYKELGYYFENYSCRRRFHWNNPDIYWRYDVHEQLFLKTQSTEIFDLYYLPSTFKVYHTPTKRPRLYLELNKEKIKKFNDLLSFWSYYTDFSMYYLYNNMYLECSSILSKVNDILETKKVYHTVFNRYLGLKIFLEKALGLSVSKKDIEKYYNLEKIEWTRDPLLKYYRYKLTRNELLTTEERSELLSLISNPKYVSKEYLNELQNIFYKLDIYN